MFLIVVSFIINNLQIILYYRVYKIANKKILQIISISHVLMLMRGIQPPRSRGLNTNKFHMFIQFLVVKINKNKFIFCYVLHHFELVHDRKSHQNRWTFVIVKWQITKYSKSMNTFTNCFVLEKLCCYVANSTLPIIQAIHSICVFGLKFVIVNQQKEKFTEHQYSCKASYNGIYVTVFIYQLKILSSLHFYLFITQNHIKEH